MAESPTQRIRLYQSISFKNIVLFLLILLVAPDTIIAALLPGQPGSIISMPSIEGISIEPHGAKLDFS